MVFPPVVDTGGRFITGVNDGRGKFITRKLQKQLQLASPFK